MHKFITCVQYLFNAIRKGSSFMAEPRFLNWRAIFYPESLPPNWLEILQSRQIAFCVSPLHDRDVIPVTGEVKKAHYHVIFHFDGKKSYSQVESICNYLGQPRPEPCDSIRGAVRYLVHADSPDKYQYPIEQIQAFGMQVKPYFSCDVFERSRILSNLVDICNEQHISNYTELVDFVKNKIDSMDYLDIVSHNTFFFIHYLNNKF